MSMTRLSRVVTAVRPDRCKAAIRGSSRAWPSVWLRSSLIVGASSRLLADHLNVDTSTVLRTWRHHRVQPWRAETFKFSTDPELVAKVTDVVGLYLNPRAPRGADDLSGGERPSPPDLSQQGR